MLVFLWRAEHVTGLKDLKILFPLDIPWLVFAPYLFLKFDSFTKYLRYKQDLLSMEEMEIYLDLPSVFFTT